MIVKAFLHYSSYFWALTNFGARRFYSGNGKKIGVPVVSIGNLIAGGVGKTEMVSYIAAHYIQKGLKVMIAMRGYGSEFEDSGICIDSIEPALKDRLPDEAMVHLIKVPKVCISIGKDRIEQILKNLDRFKPDLILLDDGFQHFKMHRDLDILVQNSDVHFPILRDFSFESKNVDCLIEFGQLRSDVGTTTKIHATYELDSVKDIRGNPSEVPEQALAMSAIGNPERFKKFLRSKGISIQKFFVFKDHHRYTADDLKPILELAKEKDLRILTTLKDVVKIEKFQTELKLDRVRFITLKVKLQDEAKLWSKIDSVLKKMEAV